MSPFSVGDSVTPVKQIIEFADDCHPESLLASPGEHLIVRKYRPFAHSYEYSVSHHNRTDGMTFGVTALEIAKLPGERLNG